MAGVDLAWPSAARRMIGELQRRVAVLSRQAGRHAKTIGGQADRIARLKKRLKQVQTKLDEALRAAKRQASPFSKGPPKSNPKPAGRKPGPRHGPTNLRPPPDRVDESYVAAVP